MLFSKIFALGWALLSAGICQAQTNTTEWPLHNDGLNTVVEWYVGPNIQALLCGL